MAVAVVLALALFYALRHVLAWSVLVDRRDNERAAVAVLIDRLHAEADSAWAIFTPALDVNGRDNSDGHELDFFTRDGSNVDHFWAYSYDKDAHALQKYQYASPGAPPQISGPPVPDVAAFFAQTLPITDLQNPASPIYNGLFAGAVLKPEAIHFGYGQSIAGGNQITHVELRTGTIAKNLNLTTQTAPSGFTIVFHYTPKPTSAPSALAKKFVCSTAPFGTDLGPDPDGIHEDISNGQICSPCPNVGQKCVVTMESAMDDTYCDPSSGQFGGSLTSFIAKFAGGSAAFGTLTNNGNDTYTFLRTALGPVQIDEMKRYAVMTAQANKNGGVNCKLQWAADSISASWNF